MKPKLNPFSTRQTKLARQKKTQKKRWHQTTIYKWATKTNKKTGWKQIHPSPEWWWARCTVFPFFFSWHGPAGSRHAGVEPAHAPPTLPAHWHTEARWRKAQQARRRWAGPCSYLASGLVIRNLEHRSTLTQSAAGRQALGQPISAWRRVNFDIKIVRWHKNRKWELLLLEIGDNSLSLRWEEFWVQ